MAISKKKKKRFIFEGLKKKEKRDLKEFCDLFIRGGVGGSNRREVANK